jgi:pilus assembly protein Flp/PilA
MPFVTSFLLMKEAHVNRLIRNFQAFRLDEEGATAVEYGLLTALIAVVVIGALSLIAQELQGTFETIAMQLGGNP